MKFTKTEEKFIRNINKNQKVFLFTAVLLFLLIPLNIFFIFKQSEKLSIIVEKHYDTAINNIHSGKQPEKEIEKALLFATEGWANYIVKSGLSFAMFLCLGSLMLIAFYKNDKTYKNIIKKLKTR